MNRTVHLFRRTLRCGAWLAPVLGILLVDTARAATAPPRADPKKAPDRTIRRTAPLPDWSGLGAVQSWARLGTPGAPSGDWKVDPSGDLNLITFIRENTTIRIPQYWFAADVENMGSLANFPFVFMHSQRAPELTANARANLREYLLRGGFLFAEDCVEPDNTGPGFFETMVRELARIVPEATLGPLPNEHPVFHCLFDLPRGLPKLQGRTTGLWALQLNGRVLALLSPADLHCAWTYGDAFAGAGTERAALEMGANIYVFAMTQSPARAVPAKP